MAVNSAEKERREQLKREGTCLCSFYPFRHRPGSLRMCVKHPDFGKEPSDEEKLDYERCIATPRSGVG